MTRKKRIPKRATRKFTVNGSTTLEELSRLADAQPPSVRRIVFAGTPAFLRSGRLSRVEQVDDVLPHMFLVEDPSVDTFEPYLKDGVLMRLEGSSTHHDMLDRLRIAWMIRLGPRPGSVVVSFCGRELPRAGARYYLERLPEVTRGSLETSLPFRQVVMSTLAFMKDGAP